MKIDEVFTRLPRLKLELNLSEDDVTEIKKERKPGAYCLLAIDDSFAIEKRLVAGLAGQYTEQDLVGKQVVLVANLEPAELMGVQSQGMVLAAEDSNGLHLIVPDGVMASGSKVK